MATSYTLRAWQIAIFAACAIESGCAAPAGKGPDRHVIDTLTSDFETVFFADASGLRGGGPFSRLSPRQSRALRAPFDLLLTALQDAALAPLSKRLLDTNRSATVTVGARNFRPPAGLGPVLSEVCYILQFASGGVHLTDLLRLKEVGSMGDKPIWTLTFPFGGNSHLSSIFIIQPDPDNIVIATERNVAQDITLKLGRESKTRPGTRALPGWSTVASSPYWGYRKYRPPGGSNASVSGVVLGQLQIDPSAVALALSVKPEGKTAQLMYVGSRGEDTTPMQLNKEFGFSFQRASSATWQTAIPLSDQEQSLYQMFVVLEMFGFGASI